MYVFIALNEHRLEAQDTHKNMEQAMYYKLEVHSVERTYLRQRCSDGSR